jgi:hypothetical protein
MAANIREEQKQSLCNLYRVGQDRIDKYNDPSCMASEIFYSTKILPGLFEYGGVKNKIKKGNKI